MHATAADPDGHRAWSSDVLHPLRRELHDELHARPSLYFEGDSDVWHVALLGTSGPPELPPDLLNLDKASTTRRGKQGIAHFASGRLKWEVHTEFLTLTYVQQLDAAAKPAQAFLALCASVKGSVVCAVKVVVRDETDGHLLPRPGADFISSRVGGGDAEVHSNFQLDPEGFVEILFFNNNLNAYRTGRMVRRLLEIETYRMMALLAMPLAQETDRRIAEFDQRLSRLLAHMQSAVKVDKALLSEVTVLSSEVLNFSATARHRYGATRAYAEIVASRLEEIREGRVEQRQRLGTFIDRRFQPAIRAFRAAEQRLDELAERVSLAGDLLRTTVQVQLEDQNASLLASMEERARVQVHIQQAVEGFSVIAITYYSVSLAKALLEGLPEWILDPHIAKTAILAAVPLVFLAVWKTVGHVKRSILRAS